MRAHAAHLRPRHLLLGLAILVATLLALYTHAWGQVVDDPARGPFDDRASLPRVEWTVATGESAENAIPVLAGGLPAVTTASSAVVLAMAIAGDEPRLGALGVAGLGLGPSLGQWYGGRTWNPGLAARLGAVVVGGAGALLVFGCSDGETGETCAAGGDSVLLGAAFYLAGTAYEIATAPALVRTLARRHARLVVIPMRAHEQIVPGMALTSRF